MIFQLTYSSVAKPDLSMAEIEDIIAEANQFNAPNHITGCLIYNSGFFLQILEGEKQQVMTLINKIRMDDRNDHLTILAEGQTNFRTFKEWAMAFYHNPVNTQLSKEELKVKEYLKMLSIDSKKPNFPIKIFWYNVKNLLSAEGYYKHIL